MKILIGIDTYPPNVSGAGRFTQRLAEGMVRRGHEVHVVCPSDDGPARRTLENGVVVHRVRSHNCPFHDQLRICYPWQARPDTAAILDEIQPDVVHVQAHFVVGRGLAEAAHRTDTPLVATNHFMPENVVGYLPVPEVVRKAISRWSWRDVARVFAHADVLTAPTQRAVDLLEGSAGLTGGMAVSCGIDTQKYADAAAEAEHSGAPTVLFVGRLDQEKRVNELITAFAALPAHIPGRLEIVGDGRERAQWTSLAQRLGVAGRVVLRGFVSEEELLRAYGQSDIFCMPGVAELQSLVTLEAMSAGKPIIAADAMALPHLVKPGRNGWLFEPGNVEQLTTQLATLLSDADLRNRMGEASREIVSAHALEGTLDTFEGLYELVRGGVVVEFARAA